jgi:CRP-like cAMP-binding protein
MRSDKRDGVTSRLLLSLPKASFDRIWPALELHDAAKGDVVTRVDRPIEYIYFVNRGLISLVKTMQDGRTVEISAVGTEGVTDPHAVFGSDKAALDSIIQIPGTVFRVRREAVRCLAAEDAGLRAVLENYGRFFMSQLAQTAACNRLHSLEERCCRWLLMAHDSALSDAFPLTHEFLAMMLGVQRAGVSIAARALQQAGLIDYRRGMVTITDRAGLEDTACECYGVMQAELDKLFGASGKR